MRVRIAFASSDRKVVDQHFGAAEAFVIYDLAKDDARLVEAVQFHDSDTAMDGHEGKLANKIALLDGCCAVYCNAVGASTIKQLPEGMLVDELLCGLNQSLKAEPPAWLAKAMKPRDTSRFNAMADEEWAE